MKLSILAPHVVDQIAAGEVLERPANLIKELIENSLDAGAQTIEVEFNDGGRHVVVTDDGCGIARADLRLALARHSTSKIKDSSDLFALNSFGFRGEALASISAVSRLLLTSRTNAQAMAFRVESEFGEIRDIGEISKAVGTEIRVQDLFANVPARRKFLKSDQAEHTQIKNTLKAIALAHEKVAFHVRSRGELIFNWPSVTTWTERVEQILGQNLYYGQSQLDGYELSVAVSAPQASQNVNRQMWIFVQNRWVQDRSLTAAVMEAYRNLLMQGQYPMVVLKLRVHADEIDVNVHPTKAQVKFRDQAKVFRLTTKAIREVLEKAPWLQTAQTSEKQNAQNAYPEYIAQPLSVNEPHFERTQFSAKSYALFSPSAVDSSNSPFPLERVREALKFEAQGHDSHTNPFSWGSLQVLGQLNQTYILAQTAESFFLIDQHAAHERVAFERLMHGYRGGKLEVQQLLLPLVLDFPSDEIEALENQKSKLSQLGLTVERMGPESLAVTSHPSIVTEGAISEALQNLAFELVETGDSSSFDKRVAEIMASMACHSVIRAGQAQSLEQMQSLLQQMDEFPLSSFCPHGRPVYIQRPFTSIEKEFGRLV